LSSTFYQKLFFITFLPKIFLLLFFYQKFFRIIFLQKFFFPRLKRGLYEKNSYRKNLNAFDCLSQVKRTYPVKRSKSRFFMLFPRLYVGSYKIKCVCIKNSKSLKKHKKFKKTQKAQKNIKSPKNNFSDLGVLTNLILSRSNFDQSYFFDLGISTSQILSRSNFGQSC
jgi:hypothetical protein